MNGDKECTQLVNDTVGCGGGGGEELFLPGISREIWVIYNTHIYSLIAKLSYFFSVRRLLINKTFQSFFFLVVT